MTIPQPRWIAPIYEKTTGEDFLGLRSVQTNIVGYMLPGIITITPRARYYALYSWIIIEYGSEHPLGWSLGRFIHRREQIFALANLAYSATQAGTPATDGMIGSIDLGRHWSQSQSNDAISLDKDDYLDAKLGGFDTYAGVMAALRIIRYDPQGEGRYDVLPKGRALGYGFRDAIQDTAYYRDRIRYDLAPVIPRAVLEEYGHRAHLGHLSENTDAVPTLEALCAFDERRVLPPPDENTPAIGNMRGTLGLILNMADQAQGRFDESAFRQAAAYGLCPDYALYQPAEALRPFLAHWQMFQLREYYIYTQYALWAYFLKWLQREGPDTLSAFREHFRQTAALQAAASRLGITLRDGDPDAWRLDAWFEALLDACGIPPGALLERCSAFANQSSAVLSEVACHRLLDESKRPITDPLYPATIWLSFSVCYLRLRGLEAVGSVQPQFWAAHGGARRRSTKLFVRDLTARVAAGETMLDAWSWLCQDYVVAQHIITSLDKWHQRSANTFHFNYEQGMFEWVRNGETGFTASRFAQAYRMLQDLALVEETKISPRLTDSGRALLARVLENCSVPTG